jgi:molybdenum cofactor cytidylyltransferase
VAPQPIVRAVVLAAGAGRRFGGGKLLAELDGRPLLQHVLDHLGAACLAAPVVVLPPDSSDLDAAIAWGATQKVVNPVPERGLSGSLQVGWAAAIRSEPQPDAVIVALGDQPLVSVAVLRALVAAPLDPARPLVAPRYRGGGGSNPVRIETTASDLVAAAAGDRGLGPLIDGRPELVRWLDVDGANPDVDTPNDLARLRGRPRDAPSG